MYGVVDIGSNVIRFAAYRADGGDLRGAERIFIKEYTAPLAGYVTPRNRLSWEGLRCAADALGEICKTAGLLEIEPFAFARSWFASIANGEEFLAELGEKSGLNIRLVTSREEAELRLIGAVQADDGALLIDIDGGSTEIIKKSDERCELAISLPVGTLGLYARVQSGILPTGAEIRRMEREVVRRLEESGASVKTLCAKTICALGSFAPAAVKIYGGFSGIRSEGEIPARFYDDYISRAELEPKKLAERILLSAPDKLHTLTPYVAIMRVMTHISGAAEIETSRRGLMEGYLYRAAKTKELMKKAESSPAQAG